MKRILSLALITAVIAALFPANFVNANNMGKVGEYQTISAGGNYTAAIKTDGSLWTWGDNYFGQLGDSANIIKRFTPMKIMDNVMAISAGDEHMLAIKTDDSLWTWGRNNYGQLGDGTLISKSPIKIMDNVAAISAGGVHTVAIKTDGSLWTWGRNNVGQLGDGTAGYENIKSTPIKIMDNVAAVSAGYWYTAAIKTDGSLWTWGYNEYGQLGDGTTDRENPYGKSTPIKIMDDVAAVSAGSGHTAAIKTDGSLWTWGRNDDGQLGDGTTEGKSTPIKIMDNVATVSAESDYTAAIKTDGSLWTLGDNFWGQIGDGTRENKYTPVKIMDNVAAVSAGADHTVAIKTDGSLWTWGDNNYGQLGDGTTTWKFTPVKIMDDVRLPGGGFTPSPTPLPDTGEIHRVTGYDPQNGTLQFDYSAWDYNITDKSIDYNSLVGKFVLAKTYMFDIVSIRRIDDGFGTATNIKDTSIDIDGKTYKLGGYADTIFIDENEKVHYFYDGDTIFGVFDLINLKGKIEDWNESNQTVTINGIVYTISRFSNISQSVINNIKNAVGTEVSYSADDVNDLYSLDLQEIGSIISLSPAPGTLDNLWNKSEVNFEADLYGNLSYDADNPGEVYLKNYITDEIIYKTTPDIKETNLGHTKLSFSVYNSNIPTETKLYIDINKDAKLYNNGEALVITPNKDTWSFTTQFGLDKKDLFGFINNYGSFWGADEYFEKETNKFRFTSKKNPYPIVSKDLENKIIGIIGKSEYKYYTGKQNKFNGVCFGMSFITALNKNGLFDPSLVGNTNAKSLNDLPKPVEASGQIANGTRDCINYYHMLQSKLTGGLTNYDVEKAKFLSWEKDKVYDVLTTVVSDAFEVPNNKKPFLLLMGIGGKGDAYLHAVVVLGARENKEENCYELLLKDPNTSASFFTVAKVALNYSNITYYDEEVVLLKEIDVTKINPDYLINSTANASAAFENDSEEYDIIKILGSGDFTVTNSDGETLSYNNGDLSGNMEIINSDFCDSGEDNAPEYVFTVNKSDRYTFETGDSQTKCTVKSGETFISANAYNADSVVIDKNQGININGSNITYDAFSTTLTGENMFSVSGGNTNSLNIALSADDSAEIQADTLKDVEFESLFEDKSFVFDSDGGSADVVETEAGGLAIPGEEIHDETTFSNIIKENNGGAEITFANNTAQNQTGTGIVAKYNNDGTLIDIETIDLNLSGNESTTVVYGEGNIKYKAFVWDSFDNMRPLSESVEMSL